MTQIRFLGYEDSVRLVLSPKAPPAFNLLKSGSASIPTHRLTELDGLWVARWCFGLGGLAGATYDPDQVPGVRGLSPPRSQPEGTPSVQSVEIGFCEYTNASADRA